MLVVDAGGYYMYVAAGRPDRPAGSQPHICTMHLYDIICIALVENCLL